MRPDAKKGSKFDGLLEAVHGREEPPVETPEPPAESEAKATAVRRQSAGGFSPPPEAPAEAPEALPRGRGRPATGKRSNPDYEQVSVYLRKTTHRDLKIRLLQTGDARDVSELAEELLSAWLASREAG